MPYQAAQVCAAAFPRLLVSPASVRGPPMLGRCAPEPPSVLILVPCCVAVPVLRRWLCCELGDICLTLAAGDCVGVCGAVVVHVACLLSEPAHAAGCVELSE